MTVSIREGKATFALDLCLSLLLLLLPQCVAFAPSYVSGHRTLRVGADSSLLQAHKFGFIGCGTIAAAIATGLATTKENPEDPSSLLVESMAISRRSQTKSAALKERFPDLVTIYDDNQDILDQSDIVFLTVLPEQSKEVLEGLRFDPEKHTLVSLVSTAKLKDLVEDSKLDAKNVSKMICLPSIANHQGVCLHCCPTPNPTLTSIFDAVSGVVTLQTEAELEACMMTTCMMGPLYGTMKAGRDWLLSQTNLSQEEASYLMIQQYIGAIQDADKDSKTNPNRLDDLIAEQTPGGLNEQALRNLESLGGLQAHEKVMDAILSRIRGESDGSV